MHEVGLICPESGLLVEEKTLQQAEAMIAGGGRLAPRLNRRPEPLGTTSKVMVTADRKRAYPIYDGIPILMAPEVLVPEAEATEFDFSDPRYKEAYMEMEFYDGVALDEARNISSSEAAQVLNPVSQSSPENIRSFPDPQHVWLNAVYDSMSEYDAYKYLSPLPGKRVMQLGGRGLTAVKFLLAGCEEAWLVSPMVGELTFARALAEFYGVGNQLRCVAGVGEAIPVADSTFDIVYSGGCIHHMETDQAFTEISRVLAPGGKFAAVEPNRAPFYTIGTKLLGKREEKILAKRGEHVFCRPMTKERLRPLNEVFEDAKVQYHGALFRYPLLALWKIGVKLPKRLILAINSLEAQVSDLLPWLRTRGSSIAILASRES